VSLHPEREREIVDELSDHLDDRFAELRAQGVATFEARRRALAEMDEAGTLAAGLRTLRQARAPERVPLGARPRRLMSDLGQDVRYGVRVLASNPGFTLATVLTLALGIGANTAVFSLVNATLLRRLHAHEPERLAYVAPDSRTKSAFSYPEYEELRDSALAFDALAAWGGVTVSLNRDNQADLVYGAIVTGNYFPVLGATPALGRFLAPSDDVTPGGHPVVVVSDALWRTRLGARPDVVGQEMLLNGRPFTVVGVASPAFTGAELGVVRDLYVPTMMQALIRPPRAGYAGEMDPDLLRTRGNSWLFLIGRLKPGVTFLQAQGELGPLATSFAQTADPKSPPRPVKVSPAAGGDPEQRAQMRPVAGLLLSAVGAVLLLACANVANLFLSRAASRGREIAVRLALGASRGRLVRQLLTESVLVSLGGGALGLLLAFWGIGAIRSAPPPPGALPVEIDFAIDVRVLLFTLALSILTGLVFGLAPATSAARWSLVPALKDGALKDAVLGRFGLRSALVVGQVAISLLLLVTAGLFVRSLQRMQAVHPGFDAERLLVASLPINLLRYTTDQGREFYRRVVEQVESLPGVESASTARVAALSGGGSVRGLLIEGREETDNQFRSDSTGIPAPSRDSVSANVVGPRYFSTLGIGLLGGRDFGAEDGASALPIVIVNETFERQHFPGGTAGDALGRRLSVTGPRGPWREIVGIVRDTKYWSLTERPTPIVYLPLAQNHETGMQLYVRASSDPAALAAAVRREVQALESNLPMPNVRPVLDTLGSSLYVARIGALLLAAFGGVAALLSAIGVAGVVGFAISRRTREIGVRMALGAERRDVLRLVLEDGMRPVALGVIVGLFAAAAAARLVAGFLFGVSASDGATFATVTLLVAAIGLLACLLPARRATRVDPLIALRSE
jgi:predicted permease